MAERTWNELRSKSMKLIIYKERWHMDEKELIKLMKDNLRVEVEATKTTEYGYAYLKTKVSLYWKEELMSSDSDIIVN